MNLIPGVCTQCGATLSVEEGKDCMICPYCNTPFIVEKAIQQFNTTYIINNNYNAENIYINNAPEEKDFTIVAGTVVKYVGESPDPVIPDGVRKIGIEAFKGTNITSVTLSDTVDEIEESAFEECKRLVSVINNKASIIGYSAFYKCTELSEFDFESVKEIHEKSFAKTKIGYANISFPIIFVNHISNYKEEMKRHYDIGKLGSAGYKAFENSPYHVRVSEGRCVYCGGKIKGFLNQACVDCGKENILFHSENERG